MGLKNVEIFLPISVKKQEFEIIQLRSAALIKSLFGWLVADGWCWFVLREEYCWLVAGG
jgi:hypothetical protein